jgi:hypothetical protein
MRRAFFLFLLLSGCASSELSAAGAKVQLTGTETAGCRPLGAVREAVGGGFRSFEASRAEVEARLRNEAGRLGGNTLLITSEEHGDTDSGALTFSSGVPGVSTPNTRCTNCVLMTARVFSCPSQPAVQAAARPAAPPPPPLPRLMPLPDAPPPAAPPPAQYPAAAPPTVIIIVPPGSPPPIIQMLPAPPAQPPAVQPAPEH